ncbi:fumarylacetoacetate hydrolase family protein [Roseobacter sinensis]|uniref:Fumarylacetoacetate hydrolase family protein n=1 Tax=Roseobacter sinensis TaxID=2931391 RepID=A0ABT3BHN3_9RHOB|nr:fumarylacetoacetate hydrolase family protein [Roseobacter sp. WL0113]MCV3273085.1 fumarylacetoacetate hydrolase family protein [Roseobacter sp. WL0113]
MKPVCYTPILAGLVVVAFFLLIDEDPDRTNPISAEAEPLASMILPMSQVLTLALVSDAEGRKTPLLVTGISEAEILAIDLSEHGAGHTADLLGVVSDLGESQLAGLFAEAEKSGAAGLAKPYAFDELLSVTGTGQQHVASGTNFIEHAQETQSQTVFNFPKFGGATPPVTTVAYDHSMLFDYEVELCMIFDRNIASMDDFDAATKGLFLCGDFTDRAVLSRMIDVDNFDSGSGFSDAKSGPDFFPAGGLLVIPKDWRSFVGEERIVTLRNGHLRQDARGAEMILDFRELTEKVLADATSTRFSYQGDAHRLIEHGKIRQDQVLMSGTPEGVIFMPPTWRQMTRGIVRYVLSGTFLAATTGYEYVVAYFIRDELDAQRFLLPDEQITYTSSSLGTITTTVVVAGEDAAGLSASAKPTEDTTQTNPG